MRMEAEYPIWKKMIMFFSTKDQCITVQMKKFFSKKFVVIWLTPMAIYIEWALNGYAQ